MTTYPVLCFWLAAHMGRYWPIAEVSVIYIVPVQLVTVRKLVHGRLIYLSGLKKLVP